MKLLWARWEDGHSVALINRLTDIESEWIEIGGLRPEAELLRVFLLLSQCRPTAMGPGRIPLSEILAARTITWIEASAATWVGWIRALDDLYMNDQHRREKIRASQAKSESRR